MPKVKQMSKWVNWDRICSDLEGVGKLWIPVKQQMLLLFKLHNTVHSWARVDAGSEYKTSWVEEAS